MSKAELESFGKLLMNRVRDESIDQWNGLIEGRLKGITAERIQRQLSGWDDEKRAMLKALIPEIVDTTLHHLLWMFEQEEAVSLAMEDGRQLREVSDGLSGELLDWRERYSKYGSS